MSSHHIIREKQEAALMIANGQSCSDNLMETLLEWSPFVLALDGALDRILMKNIKVDAVLGDFDSANIQQEEAQKIQPILWLHREDQSKTDFDKGLEYLIENGHEQVNVIWATGNRLDHTWNNLVSLARYNSKIGISIIDDFSRCFILPKNFKKYYAAGAKVSLMPITDCGNISTSGLKYNLENEDLILPERTSSSNEAIQNGLVEIKHDSGFLALIESNDQLR